MSAEVTFLIPGRSKVRLCSSSNLSLAPVFFFYIFCSLRFIKENISAQTKLNGLFTTCHCFLCPDYSPKELCDPGGGVEDKGLIYYDSEQLKKIVLTLSKLDGRRTVLDGSTLGDTLFSRVKLMLERLMLERLMLERLM